eukprot:4756524-Alexandrium_andersonii.AAC.1
MMLQIAEEQMRLRKDPLHKARLHNAKRIDGFGCGMLNLECEFQPLRRWQAQLVAGPLMAGDLASELHRFLFELEWAATDRGASWLELMLSLIHI